MSTQTVLKIVVPAVVFLVLSGFLCTSKKIIARINRKDGLKDRAMKSLQFNLNIIKDATENFAETNKIGAGGFGSVYKAWRHWKNGTPLELMDSTLRDSEAAVVFLDSDCYSNTTTYARNSPFHRNLNSLLSSFQSNSTRQTGFYNLTVGQHPPDTVYGLFLCRGDDTKEICRECVTSASKRILQLCPNRKTALVYYDECMLRYSNRSFFSAWEMQPALELLNRGNVSQPDRFMKFLRNTMKEIATLAANGDQLGKKYATKEVNFTSFQTLYTLAQCTLDLSVSDCETCLQTAIANLPSCCEGKEGGRVVFPSCNVWKHWNSGTPLELLDPSLGTCYSRNEVIQCIHIGLLCVQEDPTLRPSMAAIVLMLNSFSVTLQAPQRPVTFLIPSSNSNSLGNELVSDSSSPTLRKSVPSVNEASISDMAPR
ncbi:hypothetical protein V6N12_063034 [Hibiscus sabdariffa]|uniref:Gnk2-homologous domain-containing protein n=1 Tax=Hibiscus sabdariffa TaxID=183260 RepID=A0ABR2FAM5_9ROSI